MKQLVANGQRTKPKRERIWRKRMAKKEPRIKPKKQAPLTDAERHLRFVEMAREVEASDDPKDFDEAFTKIVPPKKQQSLKPP
jgi:hypothetical protein